MTGNVNKYIDSYGGLLSDKNAIRKEKKALPTTEKQPFHFLTIRVNCMSYFLEIGEWIISYDFILIDAFMKFLETIQTFKNLQRTDYFQRLTFKNKVNSFCTNYRISILIEKKVGLINFQ